MRWRDREIEAIDDQGTGRRADCKTKDWMASRWLLGSGRICSTKKDRPVGFPINAKPEPGRGGRRWIVDVNWLVGVMTWLVRSTDCARAGSSFIVSCASTLAPRYLPSLPSGAPVLDYSHSIVLQDSASALESVRAAAKLFPAPSIEASSVMPCVMAPIVNQSGRQPLLRVFNATRLSLPSPEGCSGRYSPVKQFAPGFFFPVLGTAFLLSYSVNGH